MDIVYSFMRNQKKFANLPENYKEIYNHIMYQKDSYTYLYLNESYYLFIILTYCVKNLLFNLTEDTNCFGRGLRHGDLVNYGDEDYIFLKITSDGYVVLQEIKNKGKYWRPTIIQIPSERAKEKMFPITKKGKGRFLVERKSMLEKEFQLSGSFSFNDYKILIICSKKMKDEIERMELIIKGKKVSFSWAFPSLYSTKNGKKYLFSRNNNLHPAVYFTSDLEEAYTLVEEVVFQSVVIVGNEFMKDKYSSYLKSLLYELENNKIPINYFGTADLLRKRKNSEIIQSIGILYLWSPDKSLELFKNEPFIQLEFSERNSAICEFIDYLETIRENLENQKLFNSSYFLLKDALLKLNTMPFLECIYFPDFVSLCCRLQDSIQYNSKFLTEEIDNNIIFDRLLNQKANQMNSFDVLKKLGSDIKNVAVVDNYWLESAKKIVKEKKLRNKIVSSNSIITDDMILDGNTYVFFHIKTSSISRWLLSYTGSSQYYVFTNKEKKWVNWWLQNILQNVYSSIKFNKLSKKTPYIWEQLERVIMEINDGSSEQLDFIEWEETEEEENGLFTDDTSLYNKTPYSSTHLSVKVQDNPYIDSEEEQQAGISRIMKLSKGKYFLATKQSQLFTLVENKIKRLPVEEITEGMWLIYFELPSLHKILEKTVDMEMLYKSSEDYTLLEKYQFLDWYWHNELVEFTENFRLNGFELQYLFEQKGYRRSKTFFQRWSSLDRRDILPHDEEFIKYIGLVTGNETLEKYFINFYRASQFVKLHIKDIRIKLLQTYLDKDIAHVKDVEDVEVTIEQIEEIEWAETVQASRIYTNRFIDENVFKEVAVYD